MALVKTGRLMRWPGIVTAMGAVPALQTDSTLDAAGEYLAYIYQASEAMTISHVGWRTGTASGSPTADTRIETVGADGLPTGTLFGTNTNIVSGTLSSNTFTLHALTASASIARGDFFAVKFVYNSGTSFIVQRIAGLTNQSVNMPYRVTNTSGSPVKGVQSAGAIVALGSSTTTFYCMDNTFPATTITNNAFNNSTAGDMRGLRFKVPIACRAAGIQWNNAAVAGDFTALLMNDSGTELSSSSTAFEGDRSALVNTLAMVALFDNPVTLTPGTWYRIAIQPSSTTNVNVSTLTMPSASYLTAYPHQVDAHYTTFTTGGGWIDTATDQVPQMDLIIDQLSDVATSSGRTHLVNPVSLVG